MCLVHFSIRGSSLKLYPLRIQWSSGASVADPNNPSEAQVYQQRRLLLMRQEPDELDRASLPQSTKRISSGQVSCL
jgi:hypothetical protein